MFYFFQMNFQALTSLQVTVCTVQHRFIFPVWTLVIFSLLGLICEMNESLVPKGSNFQFDSSRTRQRRAALTDTASHNYCCCLWFFSNGRNSDENQEDVLSLVHLLQYRKHIVYAWGERRYSWTLLTVLCLKSRQKKSVYLNNCFGAVGETRWSHTIGENNLLFFFAVLFFHRPNE